MSAQVLTKVLRARLEGVFRTSGTGNLLPGHGVRFSCEENESEVKLFWSFYSQGELYADYMITDKRQSNLEQILLHYARALSAQAAGSAAHAFANPRKAVAAS